MRDSTNEYTSRIVTGRERAVAVERAAPAGQAATPNEPVDTLIGGVIGPPGATSPQVPPTPNRPVQPRPPTGPMFSTP